ncbi:hypothetical protein POTOM_042334 [Populus tomentosa]|uniref:Uncharacterized protein n=1 Tax=Populus tomentosa TaxID=118781 RepID=A0A8X7YS82_POPTO|nr:hypothetical protein POTOM_042334 [Populus tomentosa]
MLKVDKLGAERLQTVHLFWMPFEERILVISHQGDVPLDDPFSVDIKRLTAGMEGKPRFQGKNGRPTLDTCFRAPWLRLSSFLLQDDLYEEAQDQWPTELRHERVIPAVDYVQALALAMASQSITDHHKQHPPIDNLGPNDVMKYQSYLII